MTKLNHFEGIEKYLSYLCVHGLSWVLSPWADLPINRNSWAVYNEMSSIQRWLIWEHQCGDMPLKIESNTVDTSIVKTTWTTTTPQTNKTAYSSLPEEFGMDIFNHHPNDKNDYSRHINIVYGVCVYWLCMFAIVAGAPVRLLACAIKVFVCIAYMR